MWISVVAFTKEVVLKSRGSRDCLCSSDVLIIHTRINELCVTVLYSYLFIYFNALSNKTISFINAYNVGYRGKNESGKRGDNSTEGTYFV